MRPEKVSLLKELVGVCKDSSYLLVVQNRGLSADKMGYLRAELKKLATRFFVIKNTIFKLALESTGKNGLVQCVSGPSAIVYGKGDIIAVCRILREFIKANDAFCTITGGFVEGAILNSEEIFKIADLESKEVLIAKLIGLLMAPLRGLVVVMHSKVGSIVRVLSAIENIKKTKQM